MNASPFIPAAPVQVTSAGPGQICPDCGRECAVRYGLMYDDRTLRCAECHDDAFFTNPEARRAAEERRDAVLRQLAGFAL